MKITFEQFRKDPQKAMMFLMLFAVSALYVRAERQSYLATAQCEKRLVRSVKVNLIKMSRMLKTQDSPMLGIDNRNQRYTNN